MAMANLALNTSSPGLGNRTADALSGNTNSRGANLSGLDALLAKPSLTFAGLNQNGLASKPPPPEPDGDEIVVVGNRINPHSVGGAVDISQGRGSAIHNPNQYMPAANGPSFPTDTISETEIIVFGHKVQPHEMLAWNFALSRAKSAYYSLKAGLAFAFGQRFLKSQAGELVAAIIGGFVGANIPKDLEESIILSMAKGYFAEDGADGDYDGISDYDRAM
jgi:hypothetical protein